MKEQYLLALYEGDPYYLREIEEELLTVLAADSIPPQEPSEGDSELPF